MIDGSGRYRSTMGQMSLALLLFRVGVMMMGVMMIWTLILMILVIELERRQ